MDKPKKPQNRSGSRCLSLFLALSASAAPVSAWSPDAEAVLESLRRRMEVGLAGQEAYDAFLGRLSGAEGAGRDDCGAWTEGSLGAGTLERFPDLRDAIAEACPRAGSGAHPGWLHWRITHASRPRRDPIAPPSLDGEGAAGNARWRLSLEGARPHARYLELRAGGLAVLAGHLASGLARTRVDFVAGSRFYADWSGTSGPGGALFSPDAALDGLGASYRSGAWTLDAAGTWNRLRPGGGRVVPERRDALLYVAGLAREGSGPGSRSGNALGFRAQAAHQRFESAFGPGLAVTVAGAALEFPVGGLRLGAAASFSESGPEPFPGGAGADGGAGGGGARRGTSAGGYAEISGASPASAPGGFRFEAHQASAAWSNPLQSPRGYLRDTLAGGWILPGRGEGGASARSRIPLGGASRYRASLHAGGSAAWDPGGPGLAAGQGRMALVQELERWTHEIGSGIGYRRSDLGPGETASGVGQSLGRHGEEWTVKATFLYREPGYRGSRPAPLTLACGRRQRGGRGRGGDSWSAEALIGDAADPGGYMRLILRQGWELGRRMRADQMARLPWTRGNLTGEMAYQLRLEALF